MWDTCYHALNHVYRNHPDYIKNQAALPGIPAFGPDLLSTASDENICGCPGRTADQQVPLPYGDTCLPLWQAVRVFHGGGDCIGVIEHSPFL